MCQWRSITCDPGLIDLKDLPEFRKTREKSAISTKLPSLNAITDVVKTTTMPSTEAGFNGYHSIKLTHDDVMTGSNSVYGPPGSANSAYGPPGSTNSNSAYGPSGSANSNSVYGSARPNSVYDSTAPNMVYGSQHQMTNGGIIFSISPGQGSASQPLMSAG